MKINLDKKLIVILGPTAVGKSYLAIKLAKKFNGEIISADSRQIYKGLDIGSGKIKKREMEKIPHHLLDILSPKRKFSAGEYQKKAIKIISDILKRKKVPFLVGGSPFYIFAVVYGYFFPKVGPNWKLRRKLEKEKPEKLFQILKKLDKERAKTIEKRNKRRLIRAIEIAKTLKKIPKLKKKPPFKSLLIGIKKDKKTLKKLIRVRLLKRMREGLINEIKNLYLSGLSFKRFFELGLEYRWGMKYLLGEISKEKMIEKLQKDIFRFARHQMNWFKKEKKIVWIKNEKEAQKLIKKFLES